MKVPAGKLQGTHGLKGELKFSPYFFSPELFQSIKKFYLSPEKEETLLVESFRSGPGFNVFLIKFKGIAFEKAKDLVNKVLYIELEELPPAEEDEFYYYQLLGARVKDETGKLWGEVKGIVPLGEYELLLVEFQGKEFYIPLVEAYVRGLDLNEKEVLVKDVRDLFKVQE